MSSTRWKTSKTKRNNLIHNYFMKNNPVYSGVASKGSYLHKYRVSHAKQRYLPSFVGVFVLAAPKKTSFAFSTRDYFSLFPTKARNRVSDFPTKEKIERSDLLTKHRDHASAFLTKAEFYLLLLWMQNNKGGRPTVGAPPCKAKKRISAIYLYWRFYLWMDKSLLRFRKG